MRARGMTLLEIGIALAIVAGLIALAVPTLSSVARVQLRQRTGQLAGGIRALYGTSVVAGRSCRLVMDLDANAYWSECAQGSVRLAAEGERSRSGARETTRDDQLTHGPTGEWNFYWNVAGVWSQWRPLVFQARDGQVLHPRVSTDFWIPRGRALRVTVWPRECDYGTLKLGGAGAMYPCPKQEEFGNRAGDDVPGGALFSFRSPDRALGLHTTNGRLAGSTCPRSNTRGCYAVTIRVRRLPR